MNFPEVGQVYIITRNSVGFLTDFPVIIVCEVTDNHVWYNYQANNNLKRFYKSIENWERATLDGIIVLAPPLVQALF
jgi:hypothetical protein